MYWQFWIVYLVSAVGLTVMWWKLTGKMADGFIRRVMRLLVAVVLFVPAQSVADKPDLAPAFIVAVFSTLIGDSAAAQAGLVPLMIGASLMFAVVAITSFVQFIKSSNKTTTSDEVTSVEVE